MRATFIVEIRKAMKMRGPIRETKEAANKRREENSSYSKSWNPEDPLEEYELGGLTSNPNQQTTDRNPEEDVKSMAEYPERGHALIEDHREPTKTPANSGPQNNSDIPTINEDFDEEGRDTLVHVENGLRYAKVNSPVNKSGVEGEVEAQDLNATMGQKQEQDIRGKQIAKTEGPKEERMEKGWKRRARALDNEQAHTQPKTHKLKRGIKEKRESPQIKRQRGNGGEAVSSKYLEERKENTEQGTREQKACDEDGMSTNSNQSAHIAVVGF